MLIYLAGPIDGVTIDDASQWRNEAAVLLVAADHATYSPVHAISASPRCIDEDTCDSIIQVNEQALLASDAVLVNLSGKSFGTPLEIKLASDNAIPVHGFGDMSNSIYRFKIDYLYPSLEDAVKGIKGIIRTSVINDRT